MPSIPAPRNRIQPEYFFFLRHAETDWNHQMLCQGQKDIPLNHKGVQEAKNFALNSRYLDLSCIVTSPLSRALETAKELHRIHAGSHFHIIPEFSERCWGLLEGISSEEMYSIEHLEESDPLYYSGKGVEPRKSFRQRVLKGVSIAQTLDPHPLIVSHGRVFVELCYALGIPPIRQIQNCQPIKLTPRANGWEVYLI